MSAEYRYIGANPDETGHSRDVQAPSSHPGVLASTGGQATPAEAVEPGQVSPSPVPAPAKQEEDA